MNLVKDLVENVFVLIALAIDEIHKIINNLDIPVAVMDKPQSTAVFWYPYHRGIKNPLSATDIKMDIDFVVYGKSFNIVNQKGSC